MTGTQVPEDARRAWLTAVDSVMASAFGRGSDEHLNACAAIRATRIAASSSWLRGARGQVSVSQADDYPQRLLRQLAILEEYAKVLAQRAEDEAAAVETPAPPPPAVDTVLHILSRFSRVAKRLRTRRADRPPLSIKDEYDVQYLLHVLLDVHFDDVRPEEFAPSSAGGNVRIDFMLAQEQVALEAKMTRTGLKDREVGDELLADIGRYSRHPSCRTLVCFVYDPEGLLKNPDGLEKDLTGVHNGLDVRVVVRPKH